jgi:tRNA A-37 threonylcarbamoyl transferase component Bud32
MVRARKLGVLTAVLYAVDIKEASISMELIDGSTVKALLHSSTLQGAGAATFAMD